MLELKTLGELSLRRDGADLPLPPWRLSALLLLLSLSKAEVYRDRLIARLWAKPVSKRTRHGLSQLLYQIGVQYPEIILRATREHIAFVDGLVVDAVSLLDAFERRDHVEVCSLYSGPFAVERASHAATLQFQHWLDDQDRRIKDAVSWAFDQSMWQALDRGEWTDAVKAAVVLRSMGISVPEVATLLESPLFDAQADWPDNACGNDLSEAEHGRSLRSGCEVAMCGREGELKRMKSCLDGAMGGLLSVLLVTGEPGIGKTRLCHHLVRLGALRGWKVAAGRCFPGEMAVAFAPIVRAMEQLHEGSGSGVRDLYGKLTISDMSSVDATDDPLAWSLHQTRSTLSSVLRAHAREQPIIMWIDDFQYADPASCSFLEGLIGDRDNSNVVLLLSCRPDGQEGPPPHFAIQDHATIHGCCTHIELGVLPEPAATTLIERFATGYRALLSSADVRRIYQTVGGRPFFIRELVRYRVGELIDGVVSSADFTAPVVPERAFALVAGRIRALTVRQREALRIICLVGMPVSVSFLVRASDMSAFEIVECVGRLTDVGLLKESVEGIEPAHGLIAVVVQSSIGKSIGKALHLVIADALSEGDSPAAIVAMHYDRAGVGTRAHRLYLDAARNAMDLGEVQTAASLGRSALRVANTDREVSEACLLLTRALFRMKLFADAAEINERHRAAASSLEDVESMFRVDVFQVCISLATCACSVTRLLRDAKSLVARGTRYLEPMEYAELLCTVAAIGHDLGDGDFMAGYLPEMHDAAAVLRDSHARAIALAVCSTAYALHVDGRRATEIAQSAVECARASRSVAALARAYSALGAAMLANSALADAERYLRLAIRLAEENGISAIAIKCYNNLAVAQMERGRFAEAEQTINVIMGRVDRHTRLFLLCNLLLCMIETNRKAAVLELVERLDEENRGFDATWVDAVILLGRGYAHLNDQRLDDARPYIEGLCSLVGTLRSVAGDSSYFELLIADYLIASGRTDDAILRLGDRSARGTMTPVGIMRMDLRLMEIDVTTSGGGIGVLDIRELRDWAEQKGAAGIVARADTLIGLLRKRGR